MCSINKYMVSRTAQLYLTGMFIGILFFLFPVFSLANTIYNDDTLASQITTPEGTKIYSWEGVSDDSSIGNPHISHIITNESFFNLEGYIVYGEINVVIQNGSVEIHNPAFFEDKNIINNIGERAVFPLQAYLNLSISPYSSIFFYGGPLNLSLSDPFYSPPGTETLSQVYYNTYSNIDFKGSDKHINNGTNNATDYAWNSTWNKAPWMLISTTTISGWVWWHEHPYGVLYIPLSGCVISYCYSDDDKECYETTDGTLRYEKLGIVYREKIQVKQGFDECIFGVTDFYINEALGQPIFYPEKTNLSASVKRPLRSYYRI